jgi:predicted nucleotidyltransferase
MEDVLGGQSTDERFAAFLADWERILARRVDEATEAFATVAGVRGLILAGSVGRGAPWPLSDLDILPIYEENDAATARIEIERRRVALLTPWISEGWWTGLDIGRLAFGQAEVVRALNVTSLNVAELLVDDRWYHALDKGFGGRALYDPDGLAGALAAWFTAHRFEPEVVRYRLLRDKREIVAAQCQLRDCVANQDLCGGTVAVRSAVKWIQTWLLERWGERDNSLGRIGTRFEVLAHERGRSGLVEAFDTLGDLDDASVERRLADAPDWVHERHDHSWRARQHIGEEVTRLQDARDTLRVCALYATRQLHGPPYPTWLAIPTTTAALEAKRQALDQLVRVVGQNEPTAKS